MLNIAVSLQHNGGFFFDKDRARVSLSRDRLEQFLDWEASGNHSYSNFFNWLHDNKYFMKDEKISDLKELVAEIEGRDNHHQKNATYNYQSLMTIQSRVAHMQIEEVINHLSQNNEVPLEVRDFMRSAYNKSEGFTRNKTGPILLGRLLRTMNIAWDTDMGVYKEVTSGSDKIVYIDVNGFVFAFWYQDNTLQSINSVKELQQKQSQLSKIVQQPIVKAQYGYIREGD